MNKRTEAAVASTVHTIVLALVVLGVAIWGTIHNPIYEWPTTLVSPHARLVLYVRILVLQWLWVGYVWLGIRHSATSMRTLIDDSRVTGLRWMRYLVIGVAAWILYLAVGAGLSKMLRPSPQALRGLQAMLPQSLVEKIMWAAFAVTAGVCEEIVYRGYLLRQLRALTGSRLAALVLQALFYSLVHLVLPVQMLVGVMILGLLLGGLAVWQKSLVPGMILHVCVGMVAIVQPTA